MSCGVFSRRQRDFALREVLHFNVGGRHDGRVVEETLASRSNELGYKYDAVCTRRGCGDVFAHTVTVQVQCMA